MVTHNRSYKGKKIRYTDQEKLLDQNSNPIVLEWNDKVFTVYSSSVFDIGMWAKLGLNTKLDIALMVEKNWEKIFQNRLFVSHLCSFFYTSLFKFYVKNPESIEDLSDEIKSRCAGWDYSLESFIKEVDSTRKNLETILVGEKPEVDLVWKGESWEFVHYYRKIENNTLSCMSEGDLEKWSFLKRYSYEMDSINFVFFRKLKKESNPRFFGVEVEISTSLSPTELQYIVTQVEPKQEPFFIMKSDSTITGKFPNMIEIVTVPCSRLYLRRAFKLLFDKLEKLCKNKNMGLEDIVDNRKNLSNGIHVHIGKENTSNEKKFIVMLNDWRTSTSKIYQKISCRGKPGGYKKNSYCKPNSYLEGRTLGYSLTYIKRNNLEKYSTCHNNKENTLEVRLFQSIFEFDHIVKCIDFVDFSMNISEKIPLSSLKKGLSTFFMKELKSTHKNKYRELKKALEV